MIGSVSIHKKNWRDEFAAIIVKKGLWCIDSVGKTVPIRKAIVMPMLEHVGHYLIHHDGE